MTGQSERRRIIVSGASRGIGLRSAIALADAGFDVLAGVRSPSDAHRIDALGIRALSPVTLDITSAADIAGLSDMLHAERVFGLVNNAGIAALGPLEFLPLEDIREQFEVNVFGHIAMIQAFLPQLRESHGRIVNIGSISGIVGFPFFGAYAASKFALEGLSDSLRRELRPTGVTVSLVQPGNIDTDIWETSIAAGQSLEESMSGDARQVYGRRFSRNANGSYGPATKSAPEKVASAVVEAMTASAPRARYLVGKDARRLARMRRFLSDALLDKRLG